MSECTKTQRMIESVQVMEKAQSVGCVCICETEWVKPRKCVRETDREMREGNNRRWESENEKKVKEN